MVSILNKWSAKDPLLSHLLRCLFFFSAFYKFHFSAEHIPGISNTAADTLSRDNIHPFLFWSHRCCRPLSHPPFRSSSYSRHPTGPHLAGPVCFVSPCPGTCFLHNCNVYCRSGIRQYTAFCQQFGLTTLPLSDLNLFRFDSYLHQQQLSPASVRFYLAALRYLQIVAVGHDPQPGEFPRLHYAVRTV